MENDNAIFEDPERLGKEKFFKMAMEKFWILLGAVLKYPETYIT